MMASVVAAVLLCGAFLAPTCAQDAELRHARANNGFGVALFKELCSKTVDQNVFFSPASVSIALGMLYAGAGGGTLEELSSVLGLANAGLVDRDAVLTAYKSLLETKPANATLDIANTVLIQKDFEILDQYRNDVVKYFQAEVRSVDFVRDGSRATAEINEWVKAKTEGKIPKLLDEALPMNTAAFLINAVYFKGTWVTKFQARDTKPLPFYNHGRDEVKVATMSIRRRFGYAVVDELEARALEVPYAGDRFSMIIVLPKSRTGLPTVEARLTAGLVDKIATRLTRGDVQLWLPKFELRTDYDLVKPLRRLGLESAFGGRADFSGISGRNDLAVSDVKHKAMVEVGEEGTVAAAVTSVSLRWKTTSVRRLPPIALRVEHPFAFFIWDKVSMQALFMGAVRSLN
ncbi:iripin-3-like [Dermacentor variabilis]|uniref:iripin-3-like n=1 Tax=Dermacentor variabilis TaxID=34621 RepID=UPI003F5B6508